MRPNSFLLTRVVEVAVHGLDLADALGREPWLTSQAADLVQGLLLGPDGATALEKLGWGQLHFLRKATGRETRPERTELLLRPPDQPSHDRMSRA